MTVGILALQGDFREHLQVLQRLQAPARLVRLPQHLEEVDRLILPGGESTTIGKLMVAYDLLEPIRRRAGHDLAVWGTCAGAILMARQITAGEARGQPLLGMMDIAVQRNGFGSQVNSFEASLSLPVLGEPRFRGVFIRAPVIESVGAGVDVLGSLPETGTIVAARQGRLLAATFHPELASDDRFHRFFLEL
ncbi:MAG: pyridoxal 5'-phosphate synthase glutaminase subunit PdxT [Chloroflexaceae bacterium]|nr:pyridoxal 5'-phosphate synthase glutaminase subunit PdxT [Chloroflexaceae bacterium]